MLSCNLAISPDHRTVFNNFSVFADVQEGLFFAFFFSLFVIAWNFKQYNCYSVVSM